MPIQVERSNDNHMSVVLDERFDFESVDPFRRSYESLENVRNKFIVIDFRNTRYIDSSALGMLINAKNHFDDLGAKMKLINTNDQIKKIFSISRFDKKFDIS
ncbi:STAS domain-containing protein [Agarilytica rhodophyticola]|uniref:STAS domain-containing protein n=1 Tax=Agarilytica rhodophyticola TaxID=1737490 RepID=UPI003182DFBC